MKHAVLMGDPSFFRIKGGRNPYTRTRWGFKKKVDAARACDQWKKLKDTFESLGAKVLVLPPEKEFPGTVFPANAGFLFPKHEAVPWSRKRFYLSSLAPHRRGEARIYRDWMASQGLGTQSLPYPFEGEADFFPAGEFYLFFHGEIARPGLVPRLGWPPYRYRFSHRSDLRNAQTLRRIAAPAPVLEIRLADTRYYHGDTAFFAFGRKREYLLGWLGAVDAESRARLRRHFGERLIPLSECAAENFDANGFQLDLAGGPHLVFPEGVSEEVKEKVRSLGFPFTEADVSEFFTKGGGSVKCLVCDLGPVDE